VSIHNTAETLTVVGEDIEQLAASALNAVADEVCGGIFSFVCKLARLRDAEAQGSNTTKW